MHGRLGCLGQGRIARFHGMLAHVPGQRAAGPQLGGVTELLGFAAGQVHHPGLGLFGDAGLAGTMIGVFERRFQPHGEGSLNPFANAFARHLHGPHNLGDRLAAMITPQNLGALHLPSRSFPGTTQPLEMLHLFGREKQLGTLRFSCHASSLAENINIWICFNETSY